MDCLPDDVLRPLPSQEEEIPALIVNDRMFTLVDPVGIHHDVTLLRLPENRCERHRRQDLRMDHIPQHTSRSHRGKLTGISHQNKMCADRYRLQQTCHQIDVHHRHFIDDHNILLQRLLIIFSECDRPLFRISGDFKQPVYGTGIVSCGFCHPLGRSSGRCGKSDLQSLRLKHRNHRVDRRRLSGSGPASQNQDTAGIRPYDRFQLSFIQLCLRLPCRCECPFPGVCLRPLVGDVKVVQHLCCPQLCIVGSRLENPLLPLFLPDHHLSVGGKIPEAVLQKLQMFLFFPDFFSARRPLRIQTGEEVLIRQTVRISYILSLFPICPGCTLIPEDRWIGCIHAVGDRLAGCPRAVGDWLAGCSRLDALLRKR